MNPQQQPIRPGASTMTAPATSVGSAPQSEFEKLLAKDSKPCEFVPFGGQDKIKLSVTIVRDMICVPTKSKKVCSDTDAKKFIMMCLASRLNPFAGDAYMIGYDTSDGPKFSLITAHQVFLKRAEVHPEYDGMRSGIILQNEETGEISEREGDFHLHSELVVGGWAEVHFKNRKIPTKRSLRLSRFKKGFGVWVDDPAGMIVKCAEADALRSSFPTMVGGLYLSEELPFLGETTTPTTSKPLFDGPLKKEVEQPEPTPPVTGEKPEPPDEYAEIAPQQQAEAPQPDAPAGEPVEAPMQEMPALKGLRHIARASGIKENEILNYWANTGATDGSQATLEEVQITKPDIIAASYEKFPEIAEQIKKLRPTKTERK